MNAEIYFPREGKAFGQTSDKGFEGTIKKLNDINVNIIYKTEVNLSEKSISEALKVSESGDEKIGLIMVADVLSEDSGEKAREFFESIGIVGKVRKIEAEYIDPNDPDFEKLTAESNNKKKEKKKKKRAKNKNAESEPIDISESIITIEKKPVYAYSVEYNNKLLVILPKHDTLDTDFMTVLYSVANKIVNPDKKESFWKRFIPCAGDRPLDIVRKVILILAICTFVVSSYILIQILVVEPAENDKMTGGIKDLLVSTDEGEVSVNSDGTITKPRKPKDGSEGVISDFSQLIAANPDTIGWLYVPNTVIDYVVVKPQEGVDSEYYLHRDFYGDYSKYGTVFMDYRSTLDSKNLILHGHHMQDGRMFANLSFYAEKGDNYGINFYKKTPSFTFNTIYEKSKWKIISVFKTNTLESQGEFFNYLRGDFSSDYDFLNFVYQLRVRSLINCPVDVNENDTIITLSTCAYDFDEYRCIVVARKVRDGESNDVDVSKASENPNPLYPDIWYRYYGGTKPTVTSFQEAFNNGEIDWYDGDKKWSENDDEELERVLSEGKKNAENMLRAYVDEIEYAEEQQEEVDKIIEDYVQKFKESKSASEVNSYYNEAIQQILKVKTKEQVESEAELSRQAAEQQESEESLRELQAKKQSAIAEMRNSIAGNEYRVSQADIVTKALEEYTKKINDSTTVEEVEENKKAGIEAIAKVKTAEEMNKEESSAAEASRRAEASRAAETSRRAEASRAAEASRQAEASRAAEASRQAELSRQESVLARARNNAIGELTEYANTGEYSGEVLEQLEDIIARYSNSISSATPTEIESLLRSAKEEIDDCIASYEPSVDPEPTQAEESSEE